MDNKQQIFYSVRTGEFNRTYRFALKFACEQNIANRWFLPMVDATAMHNLLCSRAAASIWDMLYKDIYDMMRRFVFEEVAIISSFDCFENGRRILEHIQKIKDHWEFVQGATIDDSDWILHHKAVEKELCGLRAEAIELREENAALKRQLFHVQKLYRKRLEKRIHPLHKKYTRKYNGK